MRATSLSVNLLGPCNARCPFCIASATWKTGQTDNRRLREGLGRGLGYARYHGVDTVLVTGSGEPTLQRDLVLRVVQEAARLGLPVLELQTNGLLLARDAGYLEELARLGLTTVALSAAGVDPARSAALMGLSLDYLELAARVTALGLLCRVSLNLVDADREELLARLPAYADRLTAAGVKQFTLRELGVPDDPEPAPDGAAKIAWVREHALPRADVEELRERIRREGHLLRRLSYGAAVYDYRGLSVCVATCLTDNHDEDEVRSLILQPDGHVYHSWNHRGSVLL